LWREDGGRGSFYSSAYMDDFSGVRRIVPCTNLNIDDILSLESSRDLPDKLQISFQAATEPQRSRNLGAKTILNTNLRSAEAIPSTSNTGSLNVPTRPLIHHKHLPMIRLSDDRVTLEYWQLERPHPSADASPS